MTLTTAGPMPNVNQDALREYLEVIYGQGTFLWVRPTTVDEFNALLAQGAPFKTDVEYQVQGVSYRSYDGNTMNTIVPVGNVSGNIATRIVNAFPYTFSSVDCGTVIGFDSSVDVDVIIPQGLGAGWYAGFFQIGNGIITYKHDVADLVTVIRSPGNKFRSGGLNTPQAAVALQDNVFQLSGVLTT